MGVDDDVSRPFAVGIDESEPSGSFLTFSQLLSTRVSNDHTLAARVVANIVGIIRKLYRCKNLKRVSIKYLRDTIQATSHEQMIRCGVVEHTLRLGEVGDGVDALS